MNNYICKGSRKKSYFFSGPATYKGGGGAEGKEDISVFEARKKNFNKKCGH